MGLSSKYPQLHSGKEISEKEASLSYYSTKLEILEKRLIEFRRVKVILELSYDAPSILGLFNSRLLLSGITTGIMSLNQLSRKVKDVSLNLFIFGKGIFCKFSSFLLIISIFLFYANIFLSLVCLLKLGTHLGVAVFYFLSVFLISFCHVRTKWSKVKLLSNIYVFLYLKKLELLADNKHQFKNFKDKRRINLAISRIGEGEILSKNFSNAPAKWKEFIRKYAKDHPDLLGLVDDYLLEIKKNLMEKCHHIKSSLKNIRLRINFLRRNLRFIYRRIIQFLFKNLDDESGEQAGMFSLQPVSGVELLSIKQNRVCHLNYKLLKTLIEYFNQKNMILRKLIVKD
jgi:hypothetical protein